MKSAWLVPFLLLAAAPPLAAQQAETYPVPPESVKQAGVPAGTVTKGSYSESAIFPGTTRDFAVYVPAAYDGSEPAALMVFQDGLGYLDKVPVTFDNLIHRGDMPVTIGLFVNPGVVPATGETALARYNRSFEYDATTDRYARFLVEEMIPFALKDLKVTSDPNLRAISGSSSGGIAAFQAAWERPDQFRRVFTTVGTYVGLRGGNELPVLVRKTEPKPLRVFLQDGKNDNNLYCGSWWVANQDMLASFQWAGYEVNHAWGEGGHNRRHGNAILPEALRWLWQDWKGGGAIVRTHLDRSESKAAEFLVEGEGWELVGEIPGSVGGLATSAEGELYFSDPERGKIWKVDRGGGVTAFREEAGRVGALAFAPGGTTLFASDSGAGRVVSWELGGGGETVHADKVEPGDLVVAADGTVYFSEPRRRELRFISRDGELKTAAGGFSGARGIVLSSDQSLVYTSDFAGRFVWSGQRRGDGSLAYAQPYFHLHIPAASVDVRSRADGMAVDQKGWLLVATAMGVQICDQPGRVHLIVPQPMGEAPPSKVTLHGQTLYAACGGRIFKRLTQLEEARAWAEPVKPDKPRL